MNKDTLSKAITEISSQHITEALNYSKKSSSTGKKSLIIIAACLCLIIGIKYFYPIKTMTITAKTHDTNEEITSAGTILSTGKLNADGSMTGIPLQFYIEGNGIKTIRYSVKNQWLDFLDWTEKRDEYGIAKNFTVSYGTNEDEYYYLVIYWVPRELEQWHETNNEPISIKNLPEILKKDKIVLEITFENGETMTKAININLQEDGYFCATISDYKITEQDEFIYRKDSEPIKREVLYQQPTV